MLKNIAQYSVSLFSNHLQQGPQNARKKARNTRQGNAQIYIIVSGSRLNNPENERVMNNIYALYGVL